MKKLSFFIFLIVPSLLAAQTSKQQDMEKLFFIVKLKPAIEKMIDIAIEQYKKKYPSIPESKWTLIRNSVDYNSYISKAKTIFNNNYTAADIKHLIVIAQNVKFGKQIKFKLEVKQQLYDAGSQFGKQFAFLINQLLRDVK